MNFFNLTLKLLLITSLTQCKGVNDGPKINNPNQPRAYHQNGSVQCDSVSNSVKRIYDTKGRLILKTSKVINSDGRLQLSKYYYHYDGASSLPNMIIRSNRFTNGSGNPRVDSTITKLKYNENNQHVYTLIVDEENDTLEVISVSRNDTSEVRKIIKRNILKSKQHYDTIIRIIRFVYQDTTLIEQKHYNITNGLKVYSGSLIKEYTFDNLISRNIKLDKDGDTVFIEQFEYSNQRKLMNSSKLFKNEDYAIIKLYNQNGCIQNMISKINNNVVDTVYYTTDEDCRILQECW